MLLIGNGVLVTQDEESRIFENGAVALEGDKVKEVGNTDDLKAKYPDAEFIDANGKVIMPGLTNTHAHVYSAFGRGMSLDGGPNKNFLEILDNLWWRMDKALTLEDVRYSAYHTFLDSVRYGVTTVYDHHASPHAAEGSLFTMAEVAEKIGLRVNLAYEVTDRDGKDIAKAGIKENMDFIKAHNGTDQTMVRGMFGMHAPFTLSDETMNLAAKEMQGNNAGYHIHIAEGMEDLLDSLHKHGKRLVYRLHDYDILGENTLGVHCIYVDKAEMELLAETKTWVAHNPESNMGNAVGTCPAIHLMANGVRVTLGTDSYTHDMFESMKVANLIHKDHLKDPTVAWGEVPEMLFKNNPGLVKQHFGIDVGVLKEGSAADVIVVEYFPHTPFNANTFNSHVLFGMMGKAVTDTVIAGKVIMKDRVIVTVDESEILKKSQEHAQKLWDRA